jgi:hypothetical protein
MACLKRYLADPKLRAVLNHEARGHMSSDLRRYAYAATYASVFGVSPKGHEQFSLRGRAPDHANWKSGKFADRFRVQLWGRPSTTITSHIAKDGHYFIHPDTAQCRSLDGPRSRTAADVPGQLLLSGQPHRAVSSGRQCRAAAAGKQDCQHCSWHPATDLQMTILLL